MRVDVCVCAIYGMTELLRGELCEKVEVIWCHLGVEDAPNGGVRGRINFWWSGAPTKVSFTLRLAKAA